MDGFSLEILLASYQLEYMRFMGIDSFPRYEVHTKEASASLAFARGYESAASARYVVADKKHILVFSSNIALHKQLVYHEFTHMLDAVMYADDDGRYAKLSGYTEYHASQVELMRLLGAKTVKEPISFPMCTTIDTISGERTVLQYIEEKRLHAVELFSRSDFPADFETLKDAVGVLYNYFGLRSICEMYATDYTEKIDNEAFLKHISVLRFAPLNRQMRGWFSKDKVESCMTTYWGIICYLISVNKLI